MGKASGTVPSNALAIKALQGGLALARKSASMAGAHSQGSVIAPGRVLGLRAASAAEQHMAPAEGLVRHRRSMRPFDRR